MHTIEGYEWDANKAAINLGKHGVHFADAATVYTWRGDRIRIISARQATPHERRSYGENANEERIRFQSG
ncbi:MAG TPA: BrnT family toxin [Thermoanaerobaculia bacterium]|nr:BrnT family toxin [Thermoanaerobaculia bacterium]